MYFYIRPNDRCPARDFLAACAQAMRKKFEGSFEALVRMGKSYTNQQRFKPLSAAGTPLWEFKEHDHRIYCDRREFENGSVQGILLTGWAKDKEGKSREEANRIEAAMNVYQELMTEGSKK